jgi:hypothetical protein
MVSPPGLSAMNQVRGNYFQQVVFTARHRETWAWEVLGDNADGLQENKL